MRAALPQLPACAVPRGVNAPRSRSFITLEIAFEDDKRALVEGASAPPAGTVPNWEVAAREAKPPIELAIEVAEVAIRPRPAKVPPVVSAPPAMAKSLECDDVEKGL